MSLDLSRSLHRAAAVGDGACSCGGHPRATLDTREAGHYIGIAPATLVTWRSRGEGPPFLKLGGRVAYRRSDLDAWLSAQVRGGATS